MKKEDQLAKKIWDYMLMHQELKKSDCILVFGSRDLSPAHRACDLYFQGYAPVIIFSGNMGKERVLEKAEAEVYRDIALERGVPTDAIFIENESRNSGDNAIFSRNLILQKNIPHNRIILVQKPYMERRAYATFKKVWPEPELIVTSPQMSYEEYLTINPYDNKDRDIIIARMVGDLQRIREYPKLGFQIEQEIPDDIWQAGQELYKLGFDKYAIKSE